MQADRGCFDDHGFFCFKGLKSGVERNGKKQKTESLSEPTLVVWLCLAQSCLFGSFNKVVETP